MSKSIYLKKWQRTHKKHRSKYEKMKRRTDKHFLMKDRIQGMIRRGLKKNYKRSNAEIFLGCTLAEFRKYFESLFCDGMTWDIFVSGGMIQIDHIVPCASFNLQKKADQKKCFHYSNLQPLWGKENLLKRDKVERIERMMKLKKPGRFNYEE